MAFGVRVIDGRDALRDLLRALDVQGNLRNHVNIREP